MQTISVSASSAWPRCLTPRRHDMTRVDFYITQNTASDSRPRLACRIIEKAWSQRLAVHVHTQNPQQSTLMDRLLWTFRDDSFLPHGLANSPEAELATITIAHDHAPEQNCDVLVNLSDTVPDFFSRFERVAEMIDGSEAGRAAGRERYKLYRSRGYPLTDHKLK